MNQGQTVIEVKYSMREALEIFMSSFNHVVSNVDAEATETILKFVTQLCGVYNAHALLSLDNVTTIRGAVFEDAVIRDFVLSLKFVFFSRWIQGRGKQLIEALVDDLVLGVSYDCDLLDAADQDNGLNAIPPQVTQALTKYEDGIQILKTNPWIICLLLMQIAVNLDDFIDKKFKK